MSTFPVRRAPGAAFVCALACLAAQPLGADEGSGALQVSGTVGLYGKYNSNLDLVDEKSTGRARKEALVGEPTADVRLSRFWGEEWWLDVSLSGHANFHTEHSEENWYFNRTHLSLVRTLGEHALHLSSEFRYFTEPRDDLYDFARHAGILSYKRALSPRWQVQVGYENIVTRYPETRSLDYSVHGAFAEVRTSRNSGLSAYCSYDLQFYRGTADLLENNPNASPDEGLRQTLSAGFDWAHSARHVMSGTYMLQLDRSESEVQQIGDIEGSEDSQDNEAEFDLLKHKATLLYSYRLNRRVALSAYEELIFKDWDDDDEREVFRAGRKDWLFLSSVFLRVKWTGSVHLKLRYLFRMNASSIDREDYRDHIVFLGPEYRF